MYGTEKRHLELRLRCALELSQNAEYYALQLHSLAQEAKKSGKTKFSVNSLLSATLSDGPALELFYNQAKSGNLMKSYQMAMLAESRHNARPGSYASLQHIIALASVVGVKIRSIYPKYNVKFRSFMNTTAFPKSFSTESPSSMLTIMWSSCQKHDCSQLWNPNHFVAVIPVFPVAMQSSDHKYLSESRKRQHGCKARHSATLFDSWNPANKHAKKIERVSSSMQSEPPMKSEVNKLSQQPTTPLLSQATDFPPEDTSQLLFQGSILPPVKSRESFALYQSCMPQPSQASSFSLQKFDSPKSDQMFLNLSCCNEKSHCYQKLRKFFSSWLSDSSFSSWLTFDGSKMRCKVCLTSKKKNNFTAGCSDMQRTALSRHMNCPDHMSALLDLEQRKAMVIATQNSFSEEEKAVVGALRTVYWLAKEELASSKFSSLSSLLSFQGVDYVQRLNKEDPTRKDYQLTYQSSNSVADFQAALNSVVEENVLSILQKSPLIGLMTDESTDINVSRKLMVYVKAVHPETRKACEFYIADVELAGEANSENTTKALSRLLKKKNIDRRLVVGLATDGAPVMTGTKSGVGVRLRRKCSPYLIQVHCVAHRLALASGQAADAVPLFKLYQATINSVYNYFAHSSPRTSHLQCLQTVVDDHRVTLHATFSTRWLSFRGAVDAIRKSFCSLVLCLEHEAEKSCASARGLLRAVNKASFLLATYGLSDVLPLLNKLSLVLQRKALDYADVGPIVKATVDALLS